MTWQMIGPVVALLTVLAAVVGGYAGVRFTAFQAAKQVEKLMESLQCAIEDVTTLKANVSNLTKDTDDLHELVGCLAKDLHNLQIEFARMQGKS